MSFTLVPPQDLSSGDTISFSVVDVGTNQRRSVTIEVVEKRVTENTSAENATEPASGMPTEPTTNASAQADAEADVTVETDGATAANTTDSDGNASDGGKNTTAAANGSNVSAVNTGNGSNASGGGAPGASVEETTPGFGVEVALGAILVILFAAVRRRS